MSGFKVRTYSGSDPRLEPYLGKIVGNWLNTLRWTNDWFKLIDKRSYYETYQRAIKAILARPSCQASLAVLSDDEDVCVGWAVFEGKTLHYCFVNRTGRRQRIATAVVPKDFDKMSHLTVTGVVIWKTKFPKAIFDPFT